WLDKFLPPDIIKEKYTEPLSYINLILQNAKDAGAIGMIGIANKQFLPRFKDIAEKFKQQIMPQKAGLGIFHNELTGLLLDSIVVSSLFNTPENNPFENDTLYESFELKNTKIILNKNATLNEFDSYNVGAL